MWRWRVRETSIPLPAWLLGPRSLDHCLPIYAMVVQHFLPDAYQNMGQRYHVHRLIGLHVVVVRPHLPKQSLLYQIDILSIPGVVPIIDQAPPHSASFPPGIGPPEDAIDLAWFCAMVIAQHFLGDNARGILDRGYYGISKLRCIRPRGATDRS